MRTYEFEYFYYDGPEGKKDSIIIKTDLGGEEAELLARAEAKKLTGQEVKITNNREIF